MNPYKTAAYIYLGMGMLLLPITTYVVTDSAATAASITAYWLIGGGIALAAFFVVVLVKSVPTQTAAVRRVDLDLSPGATPDPSPDLDKDSDD